jgi:hypothetical protein
MDAAHRMLKPMFLVKPGTVSRRDINRAEKHSGILIIECADPDAARYQELPLQYDLDDQARAALSLMRVVISSPSPNFTRGELTKWFVEQLMNWDKKPENVPAVKAK